MDPEATAPPVGNLPKDSPWWARWFVANIKEAWRWASVRWGGFCFVAAEAYAYDPADVQKYLQDIVPSNLWPHIIAFASLAAVILRVTNLKGNAQ